MYSLSTSKSTSPPQYKSSILVGFPKKYSSCGVVLALCLAGIARYMKSVDAVLAGRSMVGRSVL